MLKKFIYVVNDLIPYNVEKSDIQYLLFAFILFTRNLRCRL